MSYFLPFFISFLIGFLLIDLLFLKNSKISLYLYLFLALGLGLGLSGHIAFYNFMIFDQFNKNFLMTANLSLLILLLSIKLYSLKINGCFSTAIQRPSKKESIAIIFIVIAMIPSLFYAKFYEHGGWDAWASWNLKAKFLFLAGTRWQNMLDSSFVASNPHYPLLLPLINVWGWVLLKQPLYITPMATSLIFVFITAGLLFSGLKMFIKTLPAALAALVLLTLPHCAQWGAIQYSDIVLAYFLLGSCICLTVAKLRDKISFVFLGGLFLGFLSFSKSEGMIAAAILSFFGTLYIIPNIKDRYFFRQKFFIYFIAGTLISSIPTIIFQLFYSCGNPTFINGLTSQSSPSDLHRFKMIFTFLAFELTNKGWGGIWVLIILGLILGKGRCVSKEIIFVPLFLITYWLLIFTFYFINTYSEIGWWLSASLRRLLFAVLPTMLFWTFFSFFGEKKESSIDPAAENTLEEN